MLKFPEDFDSFVTKWNQEQGGNDQHDRNETEKLTRTEVLWLLGKENVVLPRPCPFLDPEVEDALNVIDEITSSVDVTQPLSLMTLDMETRKKILTIDFKSLRDKLFPSDGEVFSVFVCLCPLCLFLLQRFYDQCVCVGGGVCVWVCVCVCVCGCACELGRNGPAPAGGTNSLHFGTSGPGSPGSQKLVAAKSPPT